MRCFGRQCRGHGKVFVSLVRQTETPLLTTGEAVVALARTAQVQVQTKRYALYHAKDGDRTQEPVGVGNGYIFVPFGDPSSDIDFETFFANQGAKGFHNPNYEQDNAPGGSADPGRSLRFTEFSAFNMVNLRG